MSFTLMAEELKRTAEFRMQCVWAVPHDRQPAAFGRTVFGERGYDHQAAGSHGIQNGSDVDATFLRAGQEVEYRPVMPYVESVPG